MATQQAQYPSLPDLGGRLPGLGGAVVLGNDDQDYDRRLGRWVRVGRLLAGVLVGPWVLVKLAGLGWLGWLDVVWLGLVLVVVLGLGLVCCFSLARQPLAWSGLQRERAHIENRVLGEGYGVLFDSWGRAMGTVYAATVDPGPVVNHTSTQEALSGVRSALDGLAGEVQGLREERARVAAAPQYQGDAADTVLLDVVMVAGAYFDTPAAALVERIVTNESYTVPTLVAPRGPWSRARFDAAVSVLVPAGVLWPLGAVHLVASELLDLRHAWAAAAPGEREAIEERAHDWVIARLAAA